MAWCTIPLVCMACHCVNRSTDLQQHTRFVRCRRTRYLGRNVLTWLVTGNQEAALNNANPVRAVCRVKKILLLLFYYLFCHLFPKCAGPSRCHGEKNGAVFLIVSNVLSTNNLCEKQKIINAAVILAHGAWEVMWMCFPHVFSFPGTFYKSHFIPIYSIFQTHACCLFHALCNKDEGFLCKMKIIFCVAEGSSIPLWHVKLSRITFYNLGKKINSLPMWLL